MTCDPEIPDRTADLWTRARADYLAGHSAPVVAERYGLSLRSLRRRAADDGWRRSDSPPPDLELPRFRDLASWSRQKGLEHFPELEGVEQESLAARFELLVDPDQQNFRRFAFRQAAEAAAMSRPAEAVTWMRLVQTLERTGDRIDREAGRFREQDYIRAACLQAGAPLQDHEPSARED